MKITYRNKRLEKICTIAHVAEQKYGSSMAVKIHQRMDEIRASDTVEDMILYHIGRCHRLVFEKEGHTIQVANITEIVDYHG